MMSSAITKIESKAQFDKLVKDTPILVADCELPRALLRFARVPTLPRVLAIPNCLPLSWE